MIPLAWTTGNRTVVDVRTNGVPAHGNAPPSPCRLCGAHLSPPFLDQGAQPIANGFHPPDQPDARRFPIRYAFCPACALVQLVDPVPPEVLFQATYPFYTGSSPGMVAYYAALAKELQDAFKPSLVLEIGCNDGTFLRHFRPARHLGVEPAQGPADAARALGLTVITAPWDVDLACSLAAQRSLRNVDLVCAFHCLTHIPNLASFFDALDIVLAPDGVLVLEDPSLDAIVQAGDFAQLYDEHHWCFSVPALQRLAERCGFAVLSCVRTQTHGGSLRTVLCRRDSHRWRFLREPSLLAFQRQEEAYLTRTEALAQFGVACAQRVSDLHARLLDLHLSGKRIAALGASSKLTLALTRLAQLDAVAGTDVALAVDFCTDTTPAKIGKVIPGVGVPIIARDEAGPDFGGAGIVLCGAYVHRDAIMAAERAFLARGGQFLFWTPQVQLVGAGDE